MAQLATVTYNARDGYTLFFQKKTSGPCKTLYEMGAMTPKEARENLIVNGGTSEISVKSAEPPKEAQPQPGALANEKQE